MGQGSIVARQPADLHRRQIEIVSRFRREPREFLKNELLKSRHASQGEEPDPPPRRTTKGPRDALGTGAHLFCDVEAYGTRAML